MINIPSLICLAFLVFALFRPIRWLFIAAFALPAFGSLAVLPPNLTGGISLLVDSAAFIFLILKVFMTPKGADVFWRDAFSARRMGLLLMFTIVAVIGAMVLPKAFIGQVYVIPLRPSGKFLIAEPLQPTNGNITQSAYLVISFMTAAVFCGMARLKGFAEDFGWALIAGGAVTTFTGLLDFATSAVGHGEVLDIFRNASYAFMTEGEISGVRRLVGLMPEASAFGTVAITNFALLLFSRNLYSTKLRNRVVLPLALLCGLEAGLSTSSTAYIALFVVCALYVWDASKRLHGESEDDKRQTLRELTAVAAFGLIGLLLVLSFEQTRNTLFSLLDTMVFKKTQSESFTERSNWNEWAMKAFMGTNGIGVGVGGVRTSNFFINVLSSTGIVGALFFALFILKIVRAKAKIDDKPMLEVIHAAKFTMVPILIMQLLVGTIPDYGVVTGALFGIIVGISSAMKPKVKTERPRRKSSTDKTKQIAA